MRLIWATRGWGWGFRFLERGGCDDPLPFYEAAFAGVESRRAVCRRADDGCVALRFRDPEGRKDASGRDILHDFVVFPPFADAIGTIEDGVQVVWPLVAVEYERLWGQSTSSR